jgi:uncharacterized membrane protein YoaK (UPF0700 family)
VKNASSRIEIACRRVINGLNAGSSVERKLITQRWLCPALAFVAGFVDTATFVRAGGVFCAHVTGNIVMLASDLASGHWSSWLSLATIPVFVVSVAIVCRLGRAHGAHGENPERVRNAVFAFEGAFIGFAASLGALAEPGNGAIHTLIVLSLVAAMAAQTALHRLLPGLGTCTTVMTGNIAQWMLDWSEGPLPRPSRARDSAPQTASQSGLVLLLFITGCLVGVTTVKLLGLGMLAIPMCVLLATSIRLRGPAPTLHEALDDEALRSATPSISGRR